MRCSFDISGLTLRRTFTLVDVGNMNMPPPPEPEATRPMMSDAPDEIEGEEIDAIVPSRQIPLGRIVTAVILVAILVHWFWPQFPIRHAEGVLVPNEPYQGPPSIDSVWAHEGYTFTSLAEIELEARVLSKKRYRFGNEADTSKYDLALGWGPVSDQWLVDQIDFSQRGRWYYFHFRNPPPISPNEILNNSGNFHIVASNDTVLKTIADLKPGHIIYLRGQLVRINNNEGWNWQSSLSRTDRGKGSCELVWVEDISIIPD